MKKTLKKIIKICTFTIGKIIISIHTVATFFSFNSCITIAMSRIWITILINRPIWTTVTWKTVRKMFVSRCTIFTLVANDVFITRTFTSILITLDTHTAIHVTFTSWKLNLNRIVKDHKFLLWSQSDQISHTRRWMIWSGKWSEENRSESQKKWIWIWSIRSLTSLRLKMMRIF